MLREEVKPLKFGDLDQEEWFSYVNRLCLPKDEAMRQFFRQVVYDHFDHFNDHFPNFLEEEYDYKFVDLTVEDIREKVRFFNGDSLADMWGKQYDWFSDIDQDYLIFQRMKKDKTPPFPPVIIDSSKLRDSEWLVYGRPLHLVEGTHRTSYLLRMAERGEVAWASKHRFLLLLPKHV